MSSNTLRGVGQEGDGEGDGKGERPGEAGQAPAPDGVTPAPPDPAADASERMPELRKIRSLDSTVPGTRSLDASVPESQPSLDAKVPSMAATMMGMTAHSIPGRDGGRAGAAGSPKHGDGPGRDVGDRIQGTVQGRDVHLPVEMQRRAGVISVAGAAPPSRPEAAPQSIDYSEPTITDPVRTIADPVRVDHAGPNVISHGPWYEQEPLGSGDYDDPKPSLIGRVAIGAAVAASLAVVLFAIVRVRAQGAAQEAEAAQALQPRPVAAPAPPTATTIPEELTAKAADPVIDWGDPVAPPSARAGGATAMGTARPPQGQDVPSAGTRSAQGSPGHPSRPISAATPRKSSTTGPSALPPNLFRPKALGEAEPTRPGSPMEASSPTAAMPLPTAPPPVEAPSPGSWAPPASAGSGSSSDDRGTGDSPTRPAAKARAKKTDDPDSTLPLNLD